MDEYEFRIARLNLERGDILVFKSDMTTHERMDAIQKFLPAGVRALFISHEVELSVLTKAEIDARAVG